MKKIWFNIYQDEPPSLVEKSIEFYLRKPDHCCVIHNYGNGLTYLLQSLVDLQTYKDHTLTPSAGLTMVDVSEEMYEINIFGGGITPAVDAMIKNVRTFPFLFRLYREDVRGTEIGTVVDVYEKIIVCEQDYLTIREDGVVWIQKPYYGEEK